MKTHAMVAVICAAACFPTTSCTTTKQPSSLQERLKQTTRVALYEQHEVYSSGGLPQGPPELRPVAWLTVDREQLQAWANWLSAADEYQEAIPGIGHLAELLFVDADGNPLASVGIVLWNCIVEVSSFKRQWNGKYMADFDNKDGKFQKIRSEPFVRDFYAYMQVHMNNKLEEVRKTYSRFGYNADDLEAMLFRAEEKKPKPRKRLEGDDK